MTINDINQKLIMLPRHKDLAERLKKHPEIEIDLNVRWEQGIDHHKSSEKMFKLIETADWLFGGDYFCWKSGGDGDNGESLMYLMDVIFELEDAESILEQTNA